MSVSKEDLTKIYGPIYSAVETQMLAASNRKNAELKLKEEFAEANKFFKKDGKTLDLGKVKLPILKGAIEVKETGVNKLEEKIELQDSYLNSINSGMLSKGYIDSYVNKLTAEQEMKEQEKDVKENLKTTFDSELVDAVHAIVKQELKDPDDKEKGKKDNAEFEALVKEIKRVLGK